MKKALLFLLLLFCVFFFSKKIQAQNRHHRPNFYVNFYGNNNYFPPMRPIIYIVNQYSVYLNTVYYVDWSGCRTGHGYNIYRHYTCYSDGMTFYVDTYTYF